MTDHIIFLSYIFLFVFSTIGHGEIFTRIFCKDLLNCNVGFKGLIGFFSISLFSLISSYFFAHSFTHNIILHFFGIIGFILLLIKAQNSKELKNLILLISILLIGSYVYKNHDDFPYYHLTYSLNLTENNFIIGTGIFSHGFRTFSSIFYYNSILYMPGIKYYLFHIGSFFILIFFNFIILKNIIKNFSTNRINFLHYFKVLCIVFINIAFYRISEHGTDRSAQILLVLIFLLFFDLFFFEKDKKKVFSKIKLFLIIVFLASSMKVIYYMYLILVPVILVKKNYLFKVFLHKNIIIIFILMLSFTGNLITNYFNTGCFLYPAVKSCVGENAWSIPKKEVKKMKTHYEWWAKAGGGPGYRSEVKPEVYVKNFRWVSNWVDRHFFNKVSDTLLGIIFICFFTYVVFKVYSKKKKSQKFNYKQLLIALFFPIIFLVEWFINHPSMRYGGYILIGLPFFITTSFILAQLDMKKKNFISATIILIVVSLSLFFVRNTIRLNKEINFYDYDIIKSPYFYVKDVESKKIFDDGSFKVYTATNGDMCWAAKTPCSYYLQVNTKKFLGLNIVYRDDK